MSLELYKTIERKVKKFEPIEDGKVSIYNCGPTVYMRIHIGNLRAYTNWDILHRSLNYLGYEVNRYMNLTDVGHMTDDDDHGEDKIEESAKKRGVDPLDIANEYIRHAVTDFAKLNILEPSGREIDANFEYEKMDREKLLLHGWVRATHHIQEMINFIKAIEKHGYTYETKQAVYFEVTKLKDYSALSKQKLEEKIVGARAEVEVDHEKRHPADFVLWMKKSGKYLNHIMEWESPWGVGFPGWHIECSAMGCEHLGNKFDIHTGGVDHIAVHHTNERAQNIGAYGSPVVNYWLHNEFLTAMDGEKLGKSKGNALVLDDIEEAGFDPLDLRYLFASVNYRVPLKFSKASLQGARNARLSLHRKIVDLKKDFDNMLEPQILDEFKKKFIEALEDNLNLSKALSVVSEILKGDYAAEDKVATILDFDKVLGLGLSGEIENITSPEIEKILQERFDARDQKDFKLSDQLRDKLIEMGWEVLDTDLGQEIRKV